MPRFLLGLTLLFFVAAGGGAQTDPGSVDPEQAVRDAISTLFDGMRANDSTAVRSVFHPDARLMSVVSREGQHRVIQGDIDAFVHAVGSSAVSYDERVDDVDVRMDDGLATAWMAYRFYAGGDFVHCGVNAIQLVQDAAGWRIIHIIDTRRTGCE